MKAEEGLTQRQQREAEEAERRRQASKGGSPQPATWNLEPGTWNLNSLSADSAEGRRLGTRKRMEPQMNSDEHGWDRTGYSKEPQRPQTRSAEKAGQQGWKPATRNLGSLSADSRGPVRRSLGEGG